MEDKIGVYCICRTLPVGDHEFFWREARAKALRHLTMEQTNYALYMDEMKAGQKCDQIELKRLFQDAKDGKIDHIVIADVRDLWSSPQRTYQEVEKLKRERPTISIHGFPPSRYWSLRFYVPSDDWEGALVCHSLRVQYMSNVLQFVYDNYEGLDKKVRNSLISQQIDSEMLEDYLITYYLEPRNMEDEDFAKMIGIEADNIDYIVDCWRPNVKQQDTMIEILGKDLIAFYMA